MPQSSAHFRDEKGNILKTICAIDALKYGSFGADVQYKEEIFMREIKKAYAGFSQPNADVRLKIATGMAPFFDDT